MHTHTHTCLYFGTFVFHIHIIFFIFLLISICINLWYVDFFPGNPRWEISKKLFPKVQVVPKMSWGCNPGNPFLMGLATLRESSQNEFYANCVSNDTKRWILPKWLFKDTFEFGVLHDCSMVSWDIAAKIMDFFRFNWDEDQGEVSVLGYTLFRQVHVILISHCCSAGGNPSSFFFWSLILWIQVSGFVFFVFPISVDAGELCQQEFALVTIVLWKSILISTISWDGFPAWFFPWFSTLNPRSHSRWEPRCFLGDLHRRQSHLDLRWRS